MKPCRGDRFRLLVPVLFGVLLAGCASGSGNFSASPVSFDDALLSIEQNQQALISLTGEGELRVETSSFTQGGDLEILLRKPDTLQLTVSGPFGIRVGVALITRETFQFYSSLQNRLYTGLTTPENLKKTLRLELTFDDIFALFTGGRFLEGDRRDPDKVGSDGGNAVFTFTGGEYGRQYVVDPTTRLIRKILLLDDRGAPAYEQVFTDFQTVNGITLPRTITLTQHKSHQRFTLRYDIVKPNADNIRFQFSPPANAERVELK